MARTQVVQITDSITDEILNEDEATRVKLTVWTDDESQPGYRVELDLGEKTLAELFKALNLYRESGEVSPLKSALPPTGETAKAVDQARNLAIRTWSREVATDDAPYTFGDKALKPLGDKGRISTDWERAYDAAHTATGK